MIYIVAIGDIYGSWYVGLATTDKKKAWKDAVTFIASFNHHYRKDTSKHLRPGGWGGGGTCGRVVVKWTSQTKFISVLEFQDGK